jgi:hypothetical protein
MPNGRRGDHPLTDILHFGESEFGEPVDGLVQEIAQHPAFPSVRDEVGALLMELSPIGRSPERAPALRREAAKRLEQIKRSL